MRPFRVLLSGLVLLALAGSPLHAQTHARSLDRPNTQALLGFGTSAAVAGDEIFVGRPDQSSVFPMPGSEPGSVHIFHRGTDGWEEYASVRAPEGSVGDGFGAAVAAGGDFLLVGAPSENEARGAAYVFSRASGDWQLVDRLEAADAAPGDRFGASMAMQQGGALIGAPGRGGSGATFAYTAGDGGMTVEELTGSAAGDDANFGSAVSLEGDWALIGSPGPTGLNFVGGQPQFQPGLAYVFRRGEDGWTEAAQLAPSSTGSFGQAVLLVDGVALVGAPLSNQAVGAVTRYTADEAGSWTAAGQVSPSSAVSGGFFGASLARAGSRLLVGSPGVNGFSGAAYVFGASGDGEWTQEAMLSAQTKGLMGFMGNAVAGGEDFAIVGAPASEFFEGIGFVFRRDDSGAWTEETTVVEATGGLQAEVGGEQRCGEDGMVAGFPCEDVELVSFLPVRDVGGDRGIMVSDIWGWTDPDTGREYAILGRFDGTSFIDVTDAENPVYLGNLPLTDGAQPNLWRDVKVYANHAFIVADNAGQHGIQVFDLTRLRDIATPPAEFDEDAVFDGFASAHNIVINEESGFAYAVGGGGGGETCAGNLIMVDIREPKDPKFAGCYSDASVGGGLSSTHDAQCVMYRGPDEDYRGREICLNSNGTALGIGDVTDKENPVQISTATYPNLAYTHQGWLSEDQRYFYLNDELDELQGGVTGTRTLIWDLTDLDDPVLVNQFVQDNPASDHNLYVRGQFMYQSNYVSGLRIFDISDPENPSPVGHFDTVPWGDDAPGFAGSWSNYPFFESGNIIVSSMREGLFVLKKRQPELVP